VRHDRAPLERVASGARRQRVRIGWPIAGGDSLARMVAKQAFRVGALGDSTAESAGVVDAAQR